MYHPPFKTSREEQNQLVYGEREGSLGSGHVLYHVFLSPQGLFPLPLTPLLDILVPASKVIGISPEPLALRQLLAGMPALLPKASLLLFFDPRIRLKVSTTKQTSFDHGWPPRRTPLGGILQGGLRKGRNLLAGGSGLQNKMPIRSKNYRGHLWLLFDCRLHHFTH